MRQVNYLFLESWNLELVIAEWLLFSVLEPRICNRWMLGVHVLVVMKHRLFKRVCITRLKWMKQSSYDTFYVSTLCICTIILKQVLPPLQPFFSTDPKLPGQQTVFTSTTGLVTKVIKTNKYICVIKCVIYHYSNNWRNVKQS